MLIKSLRSRTGSKMAIYSLILGVSLILARLSSAGEQEDAFVAASLNTVNVKSEDLFYEFSDLVLRKYCPAQYHEMTLYTQMVYQDDPRITLTDLRNQKESFMIELLQECREKEFVLDLEYRFIEYTANMAANLVFRMKTLVENTEADLNLEARKSLAEQIMNVELEQNFNPAKVLATLIAPEESASLINLDYLQKSVRTTTFDATTLAELERRVHSEGERAQKKMQQKGRCPVCSKKLDGMAFSCDCGWDYCIEHRHSFSHNCTFDHKAKYRQELERKNPKIQARKVEKL